MSATTASRPIDLPAFPLSRAKNISTPEKWADLSRSLSRRLSEVLGLSAEDLRHHRPEIIDFLRTYLVDAAKSVLDQTALLNRQTSPLAVEEERVRSQVLDVLEKINADQPLSISLIIDAAILYQREKDMTRIRSIIDGALTRSSDEFRHLVLPTWISLLRTPYYAGKDDASKWFIARLRLTEMMKGLLRTGSASALSACVGSTELLSALAYCYKDMLDRVAWEKGGVRINEQGLSVNWQVPWMQIKIGIMDTFHLVMSHAIRQGTGSSAADSGRERLSDIVLSLIDSSGSSNPKSTWFVDLPLITDYEHAHGLSRTLKRADPGQDNFIAEMIENLTNGLGAESDGAGGLKIIMRSLPTPSQTRIVEKSKDKGKGKEKATPAAPGSGFQTPQGDSDWEVYTAPAANQRRNVFDDVEMDLSMARIGKSRTTDDVSLDDTGFTAQMKADILRRAQQVDEDDSDEDVAPKGRYAAFEEELDDDERDGRPVPSVNGDDTDDSEQDNPPEKKELPEDIVAMAYLRNPEIFEKGAEIRRSKPRAELRAETGWSDEQIEGWKSMLDRNPNKVKLLAKYETTLNRPMNRLPRESPAPSSGRTTPTNARGGGGNRGPRRAGRGRGGGSRGRGNGGGGGGQEQHKDQTARDRANKEKNKSRVRQGGSDRKTARGGAF